MSELSICVRYLIEKNQVNSLKNKKKKEKNSLKIDQQQEVMRALCESFFFFRSTMPCNIWKI